MANATASKVGIYNLAITKLGISLFLTDPDGDEKEAKTCTQVWDEVLNEVLELGEWRCARKRASLALLGSTPTWGYSYQYELPADCIKVIETSLGDTYPWEVEGSKILTNTGIDPLYVLYIYYLSDPTLFSPLLVDTIATRLAAVISPAIKPDPRKQQQLDQEFAALLALAKEQNKRWGMGPDAPSVSVADV